MHFPERKDYIWKVRSCEQNVHVKQTPWKVWKVVFILIDQTREQGIANERVKDDEGHNDH